MARNSFPRDDPVAVPPSARSPLRYAQRTGGTATDRPLEKELLQLSCFGQAHQESRVAW